MKIVTCGVSSTGKSTSAKMLSEHYTYPLITEGFKEVLQEARERVPTLPLLFEDFSESDRLTYQVEVIERRIKKELLYDDFVGDGSSVDMMAFLLMWGSLKLPTEILDGIMSLLKESIRQYDYVFYFPFNTGIPIVDDKRRITKPFFLKTMDFIYLGLLSNFKLEGMPLFVVPSGTSEERLKFMTDVIEKQEFEIEQLDTLINEANSPAITVQ